MRRFVWVALLVLLTPGFARARDNFLVLVADDVGVDLIGVYSRDDLYGHPGEGASPGPTPNIDQLAAEGLLFRNAWASVYCSPARAAALTGRHGFRTGVGTVVRRAAGPHGLPLAETTLPELLAATHRSALAGKWHLTGVSEDPFVDGACDCDPDHARHQGFESHAGTLRNIPPGASFTSWPKAVDGVVTEGYSVYATTDTVDEALASIASFGEDPWFVWVAFNAAHIPVHAPPAHLHTRTLSGDPNDTPADHTKAAVEAMDHEIGRLLAGIPATVLADTTILFFSDDGTSGWVTEPPFDSAHGKGTLFEGGVNVPMIVVSPQVSAAKRGREVEALVGLVDVYATVAEIAGETSLAEDSTSLVPYFTNPILPTSIHHPYAFAEAFVPNGPGPYQSVGYAIRDERHKLVRGDGVDRFYDLALDPFEQQNLFVGGLSLHQQNRHAALSAELETLVGGARACSNGVDDDGDGAVDHPDDPGCASPESTAEAPNCSNGVDDDGDGAIDHPDDSGCESPSGERESPACSDGIDNDEDGRVDAEDSQCANRPWHLYETPPEKRGCGLGFELALPLAALLARRRRLAG